MLVFPVAWRANLMDASIASAPLFLSVIFSPLEGKDKREGKDLFEKKYLSLSESFTKSFMRFMSAATGLCATMLSCP